MAREHQINWSKRVTPSITRKRAVLFVISRNTLTDLEFISSWLKKTIFDSIEIESLNRTIFYT